MAHCVPICAKLCWVRTPSHWPSRWPPTGRIQEFWAPSCQIGGPDRQWHLGCSLRVVCLFPRLPYFRGPVHFAFGTAVMGGFPPTGLHEHAWHVMLFHMGSPFEAQLARLRSGSSGLIEVPEESGRGRGSMFRWFFLCGRAPLAAPPRRGGRSGRSTFENLRNLDPLDPGRIPPEPQPNRIFYYVGVCTVLAASHGASFSTLGSLFSPLAGDKWPLGLRQTGLARLVMLGC